MKKVFVVAALAVFVLSSCKKDYTCKCDFTDGSVFKLEYSKMKKSDAESNCANAETTYKAGDPGVKCSI